MNKRLSSRIDVVLRRRWPRRPAEEPPRVGIVTVSYNTAELTAGLLFTLYRVLPVGSFERLVVIDNGSTDGSAPMLEAMQDGGLIDLVRRSRRTTHGPGLNRGMNRLARLGEVDLVWILDSDVLVLRPDALSAAVAHLRETGAALVGQVREERSYAHVSSNLLDPTVVWQRGIPPFWDDGEPGLRMQRGLVASGLRVEDFPWYRDRYLLHIGGGTLRVVADRNDDASPYWEWATSGQTAERHYHGNPDGERIVQAVGEAVRAGVGGDLDRLPIACMVPDRLAFA